MANIAKKTVVDGILLFNFADGVVIKFDPATCSEEVREQAMIHGFKQKLGDSYSQCTRPSEARMAMSVVMDTLRAGDWNKSGGTGSNLVVEAIARVTGQPIEVVIASWTRLSDEDRKAYAKHEDVQIAVQQIRLERLQAKAEGRPVSDDDDDTGPDLMAMFGSEDDDDDTESED